MATTYAAYSNSVHAHGTLSNETSPRGSILSGVATPSQETTQQKRSRMQRLLDEFKPVENPESPYGIYTPIIPTKRPRQETEKKHGFYTTFKNVVGGEKVPVRI